MALIPTTPTLFFRDHILAGHWDGLSPNSGGVLLKPTLLVIHYTASGGADGLGDVDLFKKGSSKVSAHFVVGRGGDIHQVVECNRRAWHAGKSVWKGRPNCNDFSIGIEIDNWGWLTKGADGFFRSYTGAVVPRDMVVEARHKNGVTPAKFWEAYPLVQIEALVALTKAILAEYSSIEDICGHEDISPGRKTDPGPAFPWQHFLAQVLDPDERIVLPVRKVTTKGAKLNVRGGPGINYPVLGTCGNGDYVSELEAEGNWSRIEFSDRPGRVAIGWVHNSYLT